MAPQGRTLDSMATTRGAIQVEVDADTSKFASSLRNKLGAILKRLRVPPIQVNANLESLVKQVRETQAKISRSFRASYDQLKSQAERAGKGIGSALSAALAAAIASGVGPAVSSVVALITSIGPAALAAIPAAIGVLGTLKVALFGVGDALKEVGADQEKFDEAIENLSPNAQAFARSLRSILPELQRVKNLVQDRFFSGFDRDLTRVSENLLGPVSMGMSGVADDLNRLVRRTAEYAASTKGADAAVGIFRATRQVLAEVDRILGPVIEKFLDLVIAGTETKRINSALSTAKETLSALAQTASNVAGALGSVFSGLNKDGPAVAAALAEASGALREFLASAQAQELLGTLGNVMDRIRAIALEILEVLPQLLPAVNGLASGGFGVLLGVAESLVGILTPLASLLGSQESLFYRVGQAVAIAVVAIKAYQLWLVLSTAALVAWRAVTIASTVVTVAATAAYNTARVALLLLSVGFARAGAATTVLGAALWAQVAALAATAAAWARNAALAAANTARLVAYVAVTNAVRAATVAWTAVQWLLNAAMAANPIGLVIAIIIALVAAIVIAYQKSETFRAIVDGALRAVGDAALWLWNNALVPLWNGISSGVSAAIGFFSRLASVASQRLGALVGFVRSIPGRVVSALGNVGGLLVGAGRNIIQGLINGVTSMIGRLVSTVSGAVQRVRNFLPFSPAKEGPLSGSGSPEMSGRRIVRGVAEGIRSEQGAAVEAMNQMTSGLESSTPSLSGMAPDSGAQRPGLRVWPGQRRDELGTLVIESGGTKLEELLLEVLSRAIRVRGGNVQRVLGQRGQVGVS